ncbi:hypothetical protein BJY04DRAFT_205338 [Aspergillus karnatakaensis]|uniref:uncharacterized protein n=1 Tax=Aspergillus karnatakaensis TaxID=1810916 RepID=UPI003CCDC04A
MTWAPQTYGPDGPWRAVEVGIGNPSQKIALYPGGRWESEIIRSEICSNSTLSTTCYALQAGVFNANASRSLDNTSIQLAPNRQWWSFRLGETNATPIHAFADRALDTIGIGRDIVPGSDLILISQGYYTYPGGQSYPLQVGALSLGAIDANRTYSRQIAPPINGTFITSWQWSQGKIASYSYGMHIGSVALNIPGSLALGGYDRNRVLGEVSAQPFAGALGDPAIQLLDLSLGVVSGRSPWNYPNKTGLLFREDSSQPSVLEDGDGIVVAASPVDPYLYLPHSTCNALAAELPVTFEGDYGLYFWNTSDPQYSRVVTSPSYLAFTFRKNDINTENFTVKVPFALLNLTMEAPLVDTPRAYFPCMGTSSINTYALGRAFWQAAFIGINWSHGLAGKWFLGQAPGPGFSQTASTTIIFEDTQAILGSDSSWELTWRDHWTPLPDTPDADTPETPEDDTNTTSSSDSTTDSGLSSGAIAGLSVGCAIAALVVIALGICAEALIGSNVKNAPKNQEQGASEMEGAAIKKSTPGHHQQGASEMETDPIRLYELPSG